jgi:hypothetical protein
MSKLSLAVVVASASMIWFMQPAQAGCLTGAAVGGVVGHVAGHHGLIGAAAGCAIGHHSSHRYDSSYRSGPDRAMYGRDAYREDEHR